MGLARVVQHVEERALIAEQLEEVGERGEDLTVDRDIGVGLPAHQVNGPEEVGRDLPQRPAIGPAAERRDVIHPPRVSRQGVQRIQVIRVDRGEIGTRRRIAVRQRVIGVVVPGAEGHFAVPPGQLFPVRRPLNPGNLVQQVRRASGEVDEDAVEPVAALERDHRLGERLRVKPDLVRREVRVEEVVAQGKLTHDRHTVRLLQLHGERHPFPAVHRVASSLDVCHHVPARCGPWQAMIVCGQLLCKSPEGPASPARLRVRVSERRGSYDKLAW